MNLIIASSVLIKNAVGVCGLLLLFATIVIPLIKIIVFMFGLKLASAVLEPITDSRITNFLSMIASSVSLLIVLILGCSFMYMIMSGMIIFSANITNTFFLWNYLIFPDRNSLRHQMLRCRFVPKFRCNCFRKNGFCILFL